jgi:hypothetical protein
MPLIHSVLRRSLAHARALLTDLPRHGAVRRSVLMLAAALVIGAVAESAWAEPHAIIRLQSEEGEIVGQGRSWHIYGGSWASNCFTLRETDDQSVDFIEVFGENLPAEMESSWLLRISTNAIGQPLALGHYTDAQRAAFGEPDHPGLDVSGMRGSQTLSGDFTISVLEIDYTGGLPRLVRLSMSFVQNSNNENRLLRGSFYYVDDGTTADPSQVPFLDSLKYKASKKSMKITGLNFVSGAMVKVDDVLLPAGKIKSVKSTKIVLKSVRLAAGTHIVSVVTPDGTESPGLPVAVPGNLHDPASPD